MCSTTSGLLSPLRCGKRASEFRPGSWSESPVGTVRYWNSCLAQIANQAACLEAVQDAEARRGGGFKYDFVGKQHSFSLYA